MQNDKCTLAVVTSQKLTSIIYKLSTLYQLYNLRIHKEYYKFPNIVYHTYWYNMSPYQIAAIVGPHLQQFDTGINIHNKHHIVLRGNYIITDVS